MSGIRVAVVGAGIGGLTAALALSSDVGVGEIVVFERRTGFGETGAGIQISPNASRVLVGLGLETSLRRMGTRPDRIVVRSLSTGGTIGGVDLAGAEERFGAPYLYAARSDLHTTLLDALRRRANVKLRVGRTLTSLHQTGNAVELGFEAGRGSTETVTADLAIGADGIWSRTRGLIGDTRPLQRSGFVAFRATAPSQALNEAVAAEGGLWLGRGRHVVHYPIAGGRLVNIVAVARHPDLAEDGWSAPASRDQVEAALGRIAGELEGLIGAADDWAAWPLADLPAKRLAGGHVALLGDAAHPALPFAAQGAALAIEDAAVLAAAMRPAGSDVPAALKAFEKARRTRVKRVQSAARRLGRVYHAGGLTAFVRNSMIGRLGPAGMLERQAWIYGWRPDAA